MSEGYFYGVLDIYCAMMTTQDNATNPPVFDEPEVLAKSIEVTITPAYREGKLSASNVSVRNLKRVDTYSVKLNVDKIPHQILAKILGRAQDGNGVQLISGSSNAPYVAIGFACTLDDGTKEFWWLYKGTFAELTKTAKTDSEKLEYQTPSVEGVFVRRQDNDVLAAVVDSADKTVPEEVFAEWFDKVYEPIPGTQTPPTEP